MKNILIIIMLIFITGCGDTLTYDEKVNNTVNNNVPHLLYRTLTIEEKRLLYTSANSHSRMYTFSFYSSYGKVPFFDVIKRKRITPYKNAVINKPESNVPFCDAIDELFVTEMHILHLKNTNNLIFTSGSAIPISLDYLYDGLLSNQTIRLYGLTLYEICKSNKKLNKFNGNSEEANRELNIEKSEKSKVDKSEFITLDGVSYLKPDTIRDLIVSVKTCRRAKNMIMNIVDAGESLTEEHYIDVQKMIIKCELHKLENAIQE